MILAIRNSRLTNIFWGIFSLYMFNLSADIPDASPRYQKEDLSINDQESMVEVLVEQVMGFEDTFDEYEDPDGDDQKSKITLKIDFFREQKENFSSNRINVLSKSYNSNDLQKHVLKGFDQLSTPPPKA